MRWKENGKTREYRQNNNYCSPRKKRSKDKIKYTLTRKPRTREKNLFRARGFVGKDKKWIQVKLSGTYR